MHSHWAWKCHYSGEWHLISASQWLSLLSLQKPGNSHQLLELKGHADMNEFGWILEMWAWRLLACVVRTLQQAGPSSHSLVASPNILPICGCTCHPECYVWSWSHWDDKCVCFCHFPFNSVIQHWVQCPALWISASGYRKKCNYKSVQNFLKFVLFLSW